MKLKLFFFLCFLNGCDNCLPRTNILNNLDKIEIINSTLLQNSKQLPWRNNLNELPIKFPRIKNILIELKLKFNLVEVEKHYINGDTSRLGLAYKFKKDNQQCTQFLLFTANPADQEKFTEYEQFVDYIKETIYINPHWTYRKVDASEY